LRGVDLGVEQLYSDWHAAKNDESFYRRFQELLTLEKKKCKVILPEESRVTRDLREFRKHNQ
jgi:hypothetical protein